MNPDEDLEHLRALFERSLDQPESERDAWLQRECAHAPATLAHLRRLLAQQRKPRGVLAEDAIALLGRLLPDDDPVSQVIGTDIGPYRLTRVLGEGGMGRVYLAERSDGQFSQQVALKLIRGEFATDELHHRFLRERDTLARLAHPNIAQLHDGGVSATGEPYFTLEFIEGEPITRWSHAQVLDIRGRLQLMLKVCDAVQYAHRNLVVHRDLKPSNILVTASGEPKLLDFGIAKALADGVADGLTNTQATPMTREYAAPEQVLGDPVTTATDIYALGVLLYLLLCGQMPYRRAALGQISWTKAILEELPEPLERAVDRTTARSGEAAAQAPAGTVASNAQALAAARGVSLPALRRSLRGDLERIVQRALAKLPEARYPTVSAMADDLRAFLERRPISGGTRTYQLRKFMRRHWLPMSGAGAISALIVAGALIVNADARKIEHEAQTTAAVKTFLLDLFRNANPAIAKGKQFTLREVVDSGVRRVDAIPAQQAQLKAELQNTLGTIYYHLGLHREAADLHAQAFAAVKDRPEDTLLAVTAERFEATEVAALGDNKQAQVLADDAIVRLRALRNPPAHDLARALWTAGWVAAKRKDPTRAAQLSDEAYTLAQQPPVDEETVFLALIQKASAAKLAHSDKTAMDFYRQALSIGIKLYGSDDQENISIEQNLGSELGALGEFDAAQPYLQAALDSSQRVFGEAHSRTLRIEEVLAINDSERGHVREAATHFGHMLALAEAKVPRDESVLAEIRLNYAGAIIDLGKLADAEDLLIGVRDSLQQHEGSDSDEVAETITALGYVHMLQGKLESAQSEAREALSVLTAGHNESDFYALALSSQVLMRQGDGDAAVAAGRQARDHAMKISGERSHDAAWAHYCYGAALASQGQTAQAEEELRAALKSYTALVPPDGAHPLSAGARLTLGSLLARRDASREEGMRLIKQAVAMYDEFLGADDPRTRDASDVLAKLQGQR